MPSRPVIVLILAAWLGTLGWYVHRELWPALYPGDAPPFVIELGDEVTSQIGGELKRPDVLWGVYRGDKRIGRGETRLRYFREDNTFEIETRLVDVKLNNLAEVPEMFTAYRVTREGHLRGVRMSGRMRLLALDATASLHGVVRDGKLYRTAELNIPVVGKVEPTYEPIDAPSGSVLNPMQPVPKIKGLRPGRRWRMPVMNPLGDAIEPALHAVIEKIHPGQKIGLPKLPAEPAYLDAEVLSDTVEIEYNQKVYSCYVVEYRGAEGTARTLVRVSDGAVMRQEASTRGEKITLQRE